MADYFSVDLESSSNQKLTITDAAQTGLDFSSAFTVEFWIKPESLPADGSSFYLLRKFDAGDRAYNLYLLNSSGTYTLYLTLSSDGSGGEEEGMNITLSTGVWTHIAISYDGSAGQVKFYKNGTQEGSTQTTSISSLYNSGQTLYIGGTSGTTNSLDGKLADYRLWNDVRTATEISDNYDNTLVGNESGLVAYWKFDGGLLDETTNNNDLTNVNSATFSTDSPFVTIVTATQSAKARIKKINRPATLSALGMVTNIGKVTLYQPADESRENTSCYFQWYAPKNKWGSNINFQIQIDKTDNSFGDIEFDKKSWIDSGFEFWDGDSWEAIPITGLSNSYVGNLCRFRDPAITTGTKYWRVIAYAG